MREESGLPSIHTTWVRPPASRHLVQPSASSRASANVCHVTEPPPNSSEKPAVFCRAHSWPAPYRASHEPGGSAACPLRLAQRAAAPPWTLLFSTRGPLLTERPTSQGDPQLVRFASLSGLLLPPGPPCRPAAPGRRCRR